MSKKTAYFNDFADQHYYSPNASNDQSQMNENQLYNQYLQYRNQNRIDNMKKCKLSPSIIKANKLFPNDFFLPN